MEIEMLGMMKRKKNINNETYVYVFIFLNKASKIMQNKYVSRFKLLGKLIMNEY